MQKLKNFLVIFVFCVFLLICAWVLESQSLNRRVREGLLDSSPDWNPKRTARLEEIVKNDTY
jgi:hypothetical protein